MYVFAYMYVSYDCKLQLPWLDASLAWHYRALDKALGEKRVREFRDVLLYLCSNQDLQILEGNKVVEVKNSGVNKGVALGRWWAFESTRRKEKKRKKEKEKKKKEREKKKLIH